MNLSDEAFSNIEMHKDTNFAEDVSTFFPVIDAHGDVQRIYDFLDAQGIGHMYVLGPSSGKYENALSGICDKSERLIFWKNGDLKSLADDPDSFQTNAHRFKEIIAAYIHLHASEAQLPWDENKFIDALVGMSDAIYLGRQRSSADDAICIGVFITSTPYFIHNGCYTASTHELEMLMMLKNAGVSLPPIVLIEGII